jgi:hypothetical protein
MQRKGGVAAIRRLDIPDLQRNVRFRSDLWPDFATHPITMGADAIWFDPVHSERHNWLDWKEERDIICSETKLDRTEHQYEDIRYTP